MNVAMACMQAFIDISEWWPKDADGKGLSVYRVYESIKGKPYEVNRHTLTVARDGSLAKADISNVVKLAQLCSVWAGKDLTANDLIKIKEEDI